MFRVCAGRLATGGDLSSSITTRLSVISTSTGNSIADARPAASFDIPDEVLMARTVDGDKEALGCLFRRYARLVRAVGYKILRDDSEADDLLQDVFLFITKECKYLRIQLFFDYFQFPGKKQ